ncbi:hypothetical protein [Luoshenia tenuis]|jgi:hypothetical protein|uniref:hypothetical protein n=1 Tax=Luoshenia tenuis TaxID=2763654 RepID=UPI003D92EAB6
MAEVYDYVGAVQAIYEEQRRQLQQAQQRAEQLQRQKTALAVQELESRRPGYQREYDAGARQAYVAKRVAQRDLPQQLSALGLSGGMAETNAARLEMNYGNTLGELRGVLNQALAALERQIAATTGEGELALGQIGGEFEQKLGELYVDYQQRLESARQKQRAEELAAQAAAAKAASAKSSGGETMQDQYNQNTVDQYQMYLNAMKLQKQLQGQGAKAYGVLNAAVKSGTINDKWRGIILGNLGLGS